MADPIRIANCSGFFGDRISAAREMVEGGPIDVLTGDWLAELTMLMPLPSASRRQVYSALSAHWFPPPVASRPDGWPAAMQKSYGCCVILPSGHVP